MTLATLKCSCIDRLGTEAKELFVYVRCQRLAMLFYLRLKSNPYNPFITLRVPDNSSILSAELKGMGLSLYHILYSLLLSAMQALENEICDKPLIVSQLENLSHICSDTDMIFR